MLFDFALFCLIASFACKDYELSDYVLTAEIDARVWFAVAHLLCKTDSFGEWNIGRQSVEYEIERTAENCFDFKDAVARRDEVIDCADNRQPGSDIGLKQVFYPTAQSRVLETAIDIIAA